jgi:hypothetical protein
LDANESTAGDVVASLALVISAAVESTRQLTTPANRPTPRITRRFNAGNASALLAVRMRGRDRTSSRKHWKQRPGK